MSDLGDYKRWKNGEIAGPIAGVEQRTMNSREERLEKLLRKTKGTIEQLRAVQNGCPLPSYEQAFTLANGEADRLVLAIGAELVERP